MFTYKSIIPKHAEDDYAWYANMLYLAFSRLPYSKQLKHLARGKHYPWPHEYCHNTAIIWILSKLQYICRTWYLWSDKDIEILVQVSWSSYGSILSEWQKMSCITFFLLNFFLGWLKGEGVLHKCFFLIWSFIFLSYRPEKSPNLWFWWYSGVIKVYL